MHVRRWNFVFNAKELELGSNKINKKISRQHCKRREKSKLNLLTQRFSLDLQYKSGWWKDAFPFISGFSFQYSSESEIKLRTRRFSLKDKRTVWGFYGDLWLCQWQMFLAGWVFCGFRGFIKTFSASQKNFLSLASLLNARIFLFIRSHNESL